MSPARRPEWTFAGARSAASLALLAAGVSTGVGCRSTDEPLSNTARGEWRTSVLDEGDETWRAVAAGDIDVAAPGDELVAVGAEGAVIYLARSGAGIVSEFPSDWGDAAGGDLLQVAIGDVDRELPGAEVIVVGVLVGDATGVGDQDDGDGDGDGDEARSAGRASVGVAWQLTRAATGFTRTELHRTAAPLHAVVIADLDPAFPGNEVALTGAGREVVLLVRTAEGLVPRTIAGLPGAGRSMAATDAGLVVACDDGSLVWLARPERSSGLADPGADVEAWPVMHTWRGEGALASVAARGGLVLVSSEDGVLRLFQTAGSGLEVAFERETRCLTLDVGMFGATLADIDAQEVGDEALVVAGDGTVHVVRLTPWNVAADVVPASAGFQSFRVHSEVIAEDSGPLRALAAGRFSPLDRAADAASLPGVVGVVCVGDSGRVLLVTHTVTPPVSSPVTSLGAAADTR